jgi:hypothetical protein
MDMRHPRPRHEVGSTTIALLRLAGFRYSPMRDGWILRAVGERVGPVFRERVTAARPLARR